MSFFLTAIAFIVIFSVLVLVHEWGHFYVARKNGIEVEEFGFGIPPRIWGFKKGGVLYSINLIPFGGFVRLLGEDAGDPKAKKNPRSFSNKSLLVRSKVVLAGVGMNFVLAFLLLTIGFTFGIQPLILNADDFMNGIQSGSIQIQPGIIIKEVLSGSPAAVAGLKVNDQLIKVDGHEIVSQEQLDAVLKSVNKELKLEILSGSESKTLQLVSNHGGAFGFSSYDVVFLPRLQLRSAVGDSPYKDLRRDDVILKVNGQNIYALSDIEAMVQNTRGVCGEKSLQGDLNGVALVEFEVLRDHQVQKILTRMAIDHRTIISEVFPNSAAERAGLKVGDVIAGIDDKCVLFPSDLIELNRKSAGRSLTYLILHENFVEAPDRVVLVPDKDGKVGLGLGLMHAYENLPFDLFGRDIPTSVIKVQDVRYPFWVAPVQALKESWRLSGLTAQMFGNLISSFFTRFAIPEGVAGPVGVVQLTYVFVQEGFMSLLRFMALLSLSLAIINVLPFPALDGGRFMFIVVEIILGRRLSGRREALVHAIGFIFLMILILAVTYSDILRML